MLPPVLLPAFLKTTKKWKRSRKEPQKWLRKNAFVVQGCASASAWAQAGSGEAELSLFSGEKCKGRTEQRLSLDRVTVGVSVRDVPFQMEESADSPSSGWT